jgi:hypothetical protein
VSAVPESEPPGCVSMRSAVATATGMTVQVTALDVTETRPGDENVMVADAVATAVSVKPENVAVPPTAAIASPAVIVGVPLAMVAVTVAVLEISAPN